MIKQEGKEFKLYTSDGTKLLGSHSSKESAVRQERAIQAHKHASAMWAKLAYISQKEMKEHIQSDHKEFDEAIKFIEEEKYDKAKKLLKSMQKEDQKSLEKLSKEVKYVMFPGKGSRYDQPTPMELRDDQRTLGDIGYADKIEKMYPGQGEVLRDVPMYYKAFDTDTKTLRDPSIEEILGQEAAQKFTGNIEKHKQLLGITPEIKYTNFPSINAANATQNKIMLGQLNPYIVHHELGHIKHDQTGFLNRIQTDKSGYYAPALALLAGIAEKFTGSNPITKAIRYGAVAAPAYNYYYVKNKEQRATDEALKYMKENYSPEEYAKAEASANLGMGSYEKSWPRYLTRSLGLLAANILADKTVLS